MEDYESEGGNILLWVDEKVHEGSGMYLPAVDA